MLGAQEAPVRVESATVTMKGDGMGDMTFTIQLPDEEDRGPGSQGARGASRLSMEEIDAQIAAARRRPE